MTLAIALLGAGRIGQVHARAIAANRESARLVAVSDVVPEAARALAARCDARIDAIDAIAADDAIDAVVICTPTDTHADLIEQFARAGKAVFCEKPIDLDTNRVRASLKVVAETGALLMVGFNRRFDPHFRALKQVVDRGEVGRVEQLIITSRDPGPPPHDYVRRSGGIFRDMTIHDFDMARFLLGEPIVRVQAVAAALVDPALADLGHHDTVTVLMETESGAQVTIANSRRAAYGYDQRIEVFGAAGMAQAENQRPADIVVADAKGFRRPVLHDFFMTRYLDAYAAEIGNFIAAAAGDAAPAVTGEDGLQALVLADAARRAAETGQAVTL